jgi:hypothetical protein
MDLRVEDLPLLVDWSLYQEATDTYVELSHKYIEALYVFGNVRHPGLSDLDILVVPKDTFLAPLQLHLRERLPRRFDPIIEHEVFVVPRSHLSACGYRLSSKFTLAYGRDVLAGVAEEASVTTRTCEALEAINNMLGYLAQLKRTGVLKAQSCLRVFNSQRYNARRLTDLGIMADDGYGARIDGLRARFMTAPDPECVLEMFRAFEQSVTACARALNSAFNLDVHSFARIAAVSRGQATVAFNGFQIHEAKRRASTIIAYRQELARRNYWYGFWFLPQFFPAATENARWQRTVFRGLRSGSRRWRRLRSPCGL